MGQSWQPAKGFMKGGETTSSPAQDLQFPADRHGAQDGAEPEPIRSGACPGLLWRHRSRKLQETLLVLEQAANHPCGDEAIGGSPISASSPQDLCLGEGHSFSHLKACPRQALTLPPATRSTDPALKVIPRWQGHTGFWEDEDACCRLKLLEVLLHPCWSSLWAPVTPSWSSLMAPSLLQVTAVVVNTSSSRICPWESRPAQKINELLVSGAPANTNELCGWPGCRATAASLVNSNRKPPALLGPWEGGKGCVLSPEGFAFWGELGFKSIWDLQWPSAE